MGNAEREREKYILHDLNCVLIYVVVCFDLSQIRSAWIRSQGWNTDLIDQIEAYRKRTRPAIDDDNSADIVMCVRPVTDGQTYTGRCQFTSQCIAR